MEPLAILPRAALDFDRRMRSVTADQWSQSASMDDWTVRHVADHVIGGNRMASALLTGGSRDDGIAAFALSKDDTDLTKAFEDSAREQSAAFLAAGARPPTRIPPVCPAIRDNRACETDIWDRSVHLSRSSANAARR